MKNTKLFAWPRVLVMLTMLSTCAGAAMPESIVLKNGHAFQAVAVVRWLSDGVVIKHPGGADPFRWAYLRADSRAAWQAYRHEVDGGAKAQSPPTQPPSAVKGAAATVNGEVYSKGLDQPYRFAGAEVRFFRYDEAKDVNFNTVNRPSLPEERAATATDADGKYSVEITPGRYMVLTEQDRSYRNGTIARYRWWCDVTAVSGKSVILNLNDANATIEPVVLGGRR